MRRPITGTRRDHGPDRHRRRRRGHVPVPRMEKRWTTAGQLRDSRRTADWQPVRRNGTTTGYRVRMAGKARGTGVRRSADIGRQDRQIDAAQAGFPALAGADRPGVGQVLERLGHGGDYGAASGGRGYAAKREPRFRSRSARMGKVYTRTPALAASGASGRCVRRAARIARTGSWTSGPEMPKQLRQFEQQFRCRARRARARQVPRRSSRFPVTEVLPCLTLVPRRR